jgi:hypothetical protein
MSDCPDHKRHTSDACVECGRPLCTACVRFEINTRLWCERCSKPHRKSAGAGGFLKRAAVLTAIALGTLVLAGVAASAMPEGFGVGAGLFSMRSVPYWVAGTLTVGAWWRLFGGLPGNHNVEVRELPRS